MNAPVRIQVKRVKGWRMPKDTVYVGRPSRWGNPFRCFDADGHEKAVRDFRRALESWRLKLDLKPLRGKNLACWCAPGELCHADVLLELANPKKVPA